MVFSHVSSVSLMKIVLNQGQRGDLASKAGAEAGRLSVHRAAAITAQTVGVDCCSTYRATGRRAPRPVPAAWKPWRRGTPFLRRGLARWPRPAVEPHHCRMPARSCRATYPAKVNAHRPHLYTFHTALRRAVCGPGRTDDADERAFEPSDRGVRDVVTCSCVLHVLRHLSPARPRHAAKINHAVADERRLRVIHAAGCRI